MVDLSIIIPVYNTAIENLEKCFNSINAFVTDSPGIIECLIIDDGSQPDISDWCKKFAENCSFYHFYRKENEGVSTARNLGIDFARGKYITFVDSDDFLLPYSDLNSLIFSQVYDIIFSDLAIGADKKKIWKAFNGNSRVIKEEEVIARIISDGTLNGPCCKLFRREFLIQHQIRFDRTMITGEDLVFLMKILALKPSMYYKDDCTYIYNLDTVTSNGRLKNSTALFLANNGVMYQEMITLIDNIAPETQKFSFKIKATERYIKQLFNSIAELLESNSLKPEIKHQVSFLLSLIEEEVKENIKDKKWTKAAVQLMLLSKKQWRLLLLTGKLRLFYLNLKKM